MAFFYGAILLLSILPYAPWREERQFWYKFIKQVLFPSAPIAFGEVLFADALCSLSKVFKDIGVTVVALYALYAETNIVMYHDSAMIFISLLASLPFM